MKRLVITLLLLAAMSSIAAAESYIGMFDDVQATICYGDTEVYVTKSVHFIAYLDPEIPAITAAEFSVPNLPESGALGIVTASWNTTLVIGNLDYGIALAFSDPVPGPLAALGTVDFFPIDAAWIGADYLMEVLAAQDSGNLVVVDDGFVTIPVLGGNYTFNCSNPDECDCVDSVPVSPTSWSAVKALY